MFSIYCYIWKEIEAPGLDQIYVGVLLSRGKRRSTFRDLGNSYRAAFLAAPITIESWERQRWIAGETTMLDLSVICRYTCWDGKVSGAWIGPTKLIKKGKSAWQRERETEKERMVIGHSRRGTKGGGAKMAKNRLGGTRHDSPLFTRQILSCARASRPDIKFQSMMEHPPFS